MIPASSQLLPSGGLVVDVVAVRGVVVVVVVVVIVVVVVVVVVEMMLFCTPPPLPAKTFIVYLPVMVCVSQTPNTFDV